ncbi:hypothetical protein B0H11DRAFT_1927399 [Mycena galericulata]|nr:hypothetical protein B0H11DRAFT_1927399 [Mycena galericulata]
MRTFTLPSSTSNTLISRAPIHHTPAELVTEIFRGVLDVQVNPSCLVVYLRSILARVCQDWFFIVYGTPTLWSRIYVTRCTRPTFIAHALGRIGTAPLIVHFDLMAYMHLKVARSADPWGDRPRRVKCRTIADFNRETLPLFYGVFDHIIALSMEGPDHTTWTRFFESIGPRTATALTEIRIALLWESAAQPTPPFQPFREMPLTRLYLYNFIPLWRDMTVYSHLTELRLASCHPRSWSIIRDILLSAPQIITLQLEDVAFEEEHQNALPITLPAVQNFSISYTTQESAAIIPLIRLPGIVQLRVVAFAGPCTLETAFQVNSQIFADARTVQIVVSNADFDLATSLLNALPSVVHLDFTGCEDGTLQAVLQLIESTGWTQHALRSIAFPEVVSEKQAERLLSGAFSEQCVVNFHDAGEIGKTWSKEAGAVRINEYTSMTRDVWVDLFGTFISWY